jgi:hypothetical protein
MREDGGDLRFRARADAARPAPEAVMGPFGVAAMRARHVVGIGAVPAATVAALMGGDTLAAMEHLDGARGDAYVDLELAEQIAEPAVAITVRFALPIFLPQNHQAHTGASELAPALANPARCVGAGPPASRSAQTVAVRECRRSLGRLQAIPLACPGSCCVPPPACGQSRARSPRHGAAATCVAIVACQLSIRRHPSLLVIIEEPLVA